MLYPIKFGSPRGFYGYINSTGELQLGPKYLYGFDFTEGRAVVVYPSSRYGVIDLNGNEILQKKYVEIAIFQDGLAPFRWKWRWGYLNKNGEVALEPKYLRIRHFSEGLALANRLSGNKREIFIDKSGNEFELPHRTCYPNEFHDGLIRFHTSDYKYGFMNRRGETVIGPAFNDALDFSEGLAAIKINDTRYHGRWGYINQSGIISISKRFENAKQFKEGLAAVKVEGKWGFINKSGKFVIEPQYTKVMWFREGYCPVAVHKKWGVINKKGLWFAKPEFDGISEFANGMIYVYKKNLEGYINRRGKYIWRVDRYDARYSIRVKEQEYPAF